MTHDISLWGAGTPRTLRPHWALNELGLDYISHPVYPRSGETKSIDFTELNPGQKVPVLKDGDFTLTESAAIVFYLAEKFSEGQLIPVSGTKDRAECYRWSFYCMMELDAHTMYIIRKHHDLKKLYGEAPAAIKTAKEGYEKQINVAALAFDDGRPYILGNDFSIADLLLTTCIDMSSGRDIGESVKLPGILREYTERIHNRDAYKIAVEANA